MSNTSFLNRCIQPKLRQTGHFFSSLFSLHVSSPVGPLVPGCNIIKSHSCAPLACVVVHQIFVVVGLIRRDEEKYPQQIRIFIYRHPRYRWENT